MKKSMFVIALIFLCIFTKNSFAREKITLWFWGAPPNLQEAFQKNMIEPFRATQSRYELEIEYRNSVDNDVRVSVLAGQGPDLVYTSGPSYIAPFAKAKKIEPLEKYSKKYSCI